MNTAGTLLEQSWRLVGNLESEFFPFFFSLGLKGWTIVYNLRQLISLYSYFMHSKCEASSIGQEIASRLWLYLNIALLSPQ